MATLTYNRIIDITLPIHEGMIIYTGNPEFVQEEMKSASGNTISRLSFGSHTGTHLDAPNHVEGGTQGVDTYPLETFLGPCRVLDCTTQQEAITVETLQECTIQTGERVLFKTQNSLRGFAELRKDFIYIESEAAQWLAEKNVALVGVDYLSIKKAGLPDNTAHTALLLHKPAIPIIEGLNLAEVETGEYTLVVLPLSLPGVDGSPVRALLLQ